MEKRTKKEHTYNEREKKKSSRGRTWISKEEELESVKKLIDTADKKAKEVEKQNDATKMKALLME